MIGGRTACAVALGLPALWKRDHGGWYRGQKEPREETMVAWTRMGALEKARSLDFRKVEPASCTDPWLEGTWTSGWWVSLRPWGASSGSPRPHLPLRPEVDPGRGPGRLRALPHVHGRCPADASRADVVPLHQRRGHLRHVGDGDFHRGAGGMAAAQGHPTCPAPTSQGLRARDPGLPKPWISSPSTPASPSG